MMMGVEYITTIAAAATKSMKNFLETYAAYTLINLPN